MLLLMYHRIAEPQIDPWGLCVSADRFAQHLEVLESEATIVPLADFAGGRVPAAPRTAVVTFDDGYADNLYEAKPLLERFEAPATIFVATALLDHGREFWWDELERILLQSRSLPAVLDLVIGTEALHWVVEDPAELSPDAHRAARTWRAWDQCPTLRHRLYVDLWNRIRAVPHEQQQTALAALFAWAGEDPAPRPSHRTLTLDEVGIVAAGELVEIGAHTVTHPLLPALPASAQRAELAQSKQALESILGRTVSSFAYPFGEHDDTTVALVRECGFTVACTTRPAAAFGDIDLLRLPRVAVQDWSREEFSARLSGYW